MTRKPKRKPTRAKSDGPRNTMIGEQTLFCERKVGLQLRLKRHYDPVLCRCIYSFDVLEFKRPRMRKDIWGKPRMRWVSLGLREDAIQLMLKGATK